MDPDNGPSRELAKTMLARMVDAKRRDLNAYELLLKMAEKLEDGSPLEEALWGLLCNQRAGPW